MVSSRRVKRGSNSQSTSKTPTAPKSPGLKAGASATGNADATIVSLRSANSGAPLNSRAAP